jgi:WD40 repeat protein
VVAKIDDKGEISYRFFRARPTTAPLNPSTSFYSPSTPTATPESRRRTILPFKVGADDRSAAGSPRRLWADEGNSKTWSARERVKAVSCVDLSPNGKFLAVGEIGYNPRVNIFSTLPGASADIPLTTLTDHSFGLRCLAFSSDSHWLATLGDVNDGFLFIWGISPRTGVAKLHFTNKCTASVLSMAWYGNNLVTVGTRYVKVWRVGPPSISTPAKQGRSFYDSDGNASPAPKTLSGRNCLLGAMADSTFTYVAPISDYEAILCTNSGLVCLLDDRTGTQELRFLRRLKAPLQSAAVDLQAQRIWFTGRSGGLQSESLESLRIGGSPCSVTSPSSHDGTLTRVSSSTSSSSTGSPCVSRQAEPSESPRGLRRTRSTMASICLPNAVVSVNEERSIRIQRHLGDETQAALNPSSDTILRAHNDAVYGVVPLPKLSASGDYVTWSVSGAVNFWTLDGSLKRSERIELDQPEQTFGDNEEPANELRIVRVSPDGQTLFSGDRHGVLQVVDCRSSTTEKVRLHSAEITDIGLTVLGESLLVATCSRDRTVQLLQLQDGQSELLQTFDDHVGAVSGVRFVEDYLVSSSSDRTVIVRQKVSRSNVGGTTSTAYSSKRVITLKASPTSITLSEPGTLAISTMDRQVLSFNLATGSAISSFKAADADGEDSVILNCLTIRRISDRQRALVGFSSTDKSLRIYDFDEGSLVARDWGHAEGISDVAVLEHDDDARGQGKKTLVSTGLDGLIMIWDMSEAQSQQVGMPLKELSQGRAMTIPDLDDTPVRESILKRPPLRKVLSIECSRAVSTTSEKEAFEVRLGNSWA